MAGIRQPVRERSMAFPRLMAMPRTLVGAAFLLLYVAFDWISYVQPFGRLGITPWNPGAGLSFALILVFGQRFLPLLFGGPLLADIVVRQFPAPLPVEIAGCIIIGMTYGMATWLLLRPSLAFQLALTSMRDLYLLCGLAVLASAIVAGALVSLLTASGLIEAPDFMRAALRYWIGDVIGIAVFTPFLLMLVTRGQLLRPNWETLLQVTCIGGALATVFAHDQGPELQLLYLLFLPVIWIAVRSGLEGVTIGLVLTQLGLMMAIYASSAVVDATAFQTLMLIITLTGLATGLLVSERRRAELQLRLQQEEHARISRLASMSELAAGIAHEINQPLMAAGTYARLVVRHLQEEVDVAAAQAAAGRAAAQVERAAGVVRSLRSLVRLGRHETAPVSVARLASAAVDVVGPMLSDAQVSVHSSVPADLPNIMVDAVQIEQVLINILRNSTEAISSSSARGDIYLTAELMKEEGVVIRIADTGPGFPVPPSELLASPFSSSKSDGLGIGLALSRSIIESHGGTLTISSSGRGATVEVRLPAVTARHDKR